MNRRTDSTDDSALDRVLSRWMHDEAPARAPDRLIDDVRVAASATRQGHAGPRMRFALGALAAAAVVALAVVAVGRLPGLIDEVGSGPSPTASPSASAAAPTASEAAPSETPAPSASQSIPPTGAGDSLLTFTPSCDVVPPVLVPATTIVEDGRAVWRDENGAYHVRQLSSVGLEQLRAEIDGTGLFETSGNYELVRRQDAPEPPGHGVCVWTFAWSDGDSPTVDVASVGWLGDEEEAAYYEPSPERRALDDLAQQLMDPEAWFTDDDWLQPAAAPFEPDRYLVTAGVFGPEAATEGAPDIDTVSWPFADAPDAFGVPTGSVPASRCAAADAAAVEQLAADLATSGLDQFSGPLSGSSAILPWAARVASVEVSVWPVMPDSSPGCPTGS